MKRFGDKVEMVLNVRRFDGSDGILIFEFLGRLIREAELAEMNEA